MQTPIRVKIGMIWKKSRYISSDMQTLISFTKKYYQMHSLIPSDKKRTGIEYIPAVFCNLFLFLWKIVSYNLTVFHTKCRIFFIRHIVKIRLHDTRNAVVCDENIRFFHRILPEFHPADYRFSAPAAESIRRPRGSLRSIPSPF